MKVVDLFCGCGGLSLGFIQAGFDIVAGYDFWDEALEVYKKNFKHDAIKQDLANATDASVAIKKYCPDMIIGGPPCQDFSSAGKRNENNGRGGLTVSYAKIISSVMPQWFVMENVERIKNTQKLAAAIEIYKKAGYGLTYTILDASLCGVPQKRKRFIMIGKLGEVDNFMQSYLNENLSKKSMTVAEYFGDKIDVDYYYRHPRSYARRGIFSIDEPSPTIRGVNRPMPTGYELHHNDPVKSKDGIRPLTTKERSMIQTFPNDFIFLGSKTVQEQMIGNAVPVNLAKYVANAIKNYIARRFEQLQTEEQCLAKKYMCLP